MNPAVCKLGPAAAVVAVSVRCRRQLCPQLAVTAGASGASSAVPSASHLPPVTCWQRRHGRAGPRRDVRAGLRVRRERTELAPGGGASVIGGGWYL